MTNFDLNGKRFTLTKNTAGDAIPGETVFDFSQEGKTVWATYQGGGVEKGTIVGQFIEDDLMELLFQQVTAEGVLKGGTALTRVEKGQNGQLVFHDYWTFKINGSGHGYAVFEEID